MKKITLTVEELERIRQVATLRRSESIKMGLNGMQQNAPRKYNEEQKLGIEISSTAAELAAAKALGLEWDGPVNTFKQPDIKPNIQVRSSERHDRKLIVRNADSNEHFYVLSTGCGSEFIVWGGIYGHEAKQEKWMKNPGDREPAYFVPKEALYEKV